MKFQQNYSINPLELGRGKLGKLVYKVEAKQCVGCNIRFH